MKRSEYPAAFELGTAWPEQRCKTLRAYLHEAAGKFERGGRIHAFRGVCRAYGNLRASFDRRQFGDADPVIVETELLEEFLLRARSDLTQQEKCRLLLSEARWGSKRNTAALVVARHRGVPTRCVDWTDCYLRALYFACIGESSADGEVWWFDRVEFEQCVAAQWPGLFGKGGQVEAEIEQSFIHADGSRWITQLRYALIEDDRLDRQAAWITVAGWLGACHAEELHRLGIRDKGRLVVPAGLKLEARRFLEDLGITGPALGLKRGDAADAIAEKLASEFHQRFPSRAECGSRNRD